MQDEASMITKKPATMPSKVRGSLLKFSLLKRFSCVLEAACFYASESPERLLVADGRMELTYAQALDAVSRQAAFLKSSMGVERGERVVAECCQSAQSLVLELACHSLGAVFVPLEARCKPEKIAAIALKCAARLAVAVKPLDACPVKSITYGELSARSEGGGLPIRLPKKEETSEILFTTGTTGAEKGIVLTHGASVAVAENIASGARIQEGNVELIPSPISHSHGLRSCYANILCGGSIVLCQLAASVKELFALMERYAVNALDLVPAALSVILKLSGNKIGEWSGRLRYIEFGSAAMHASDRAKICSLLPGTPLYNFYGSTEAGRATVYNFNRPDCKENCIGCPTINSVIAVVGDDRKPIASSKESTGLLACGGAMLMQGYYNEESETARVMQGGFVYTNDEAYIDGDGDIILLGRKDDVISVGGIKVSPEEIESAARGIAGVADCACIPVPDEVAGSAPKLFVTREKSSPLDVNKIAGLLAQRLEAYKVPKYIEEIDEIPRTYNGKVSRRELRALNDGGRAK